MKNKEWKKRVSDARRYNELVAENDAMKLKIRHLTRGYKRVVKELSKLGDKYEDALSELDMTEACLKALRENYVYVCNADMAKGRETDNLRKELTKLRSDNVKLKQDRSTLIDLLEEKGFTLVKNTECPHDMVETGEPFCKENPETVRVDSIACWNCEFFCLRLGDRGKIVCKEGQKRPQDMA